MKESVWSLKEKTLDISFPTFKLPASINYLLRLTR